MCTLGSNSLHVRQQVRLCRTLASSMPISIVAMDLPLLTKLSSSVLGRAGGGRIICSTATSATDHLLRVRLLRLAKTCSRILQQSAPARLTHTLNGDCTRLQ